MAYAVFPGGKRLRPILTIESSRILKGNMKKTLPFACAVEFAHNFSLIHDDLPAMDNDDTRRGRPACHKRFGEGMAILAGDGLLSLAFGIISGSKEKSAPEIARVLTDAVGAGNMIGGQALDIKYKNRLKKMSKLKSKIDAMKTAALMAASCRVGALAAGGGARDIKRIYEYGRNLGLAFQIADDIRDSRHAKSALADMRKKTEFFISKAKKCLATFGEKAGTLKCIADSTLRHG